MRFLFSLLSLLFFREPAPQATPVTTIERAPAPQAAASTTVVRAPTPQSELYVIDLTPTSAKPCSK